MTKRIAVIGAGMSGLTAATTLSDSGAEITVFDKSRGVGGRLATRRAGELAFDHGAPYIEVDPPDFANFIAGTGARQSAGQARGVPGMSSLLRPLANRVPVTSSCEITGLVGGPGDWHLTDRDGGAYGPFDAVLVCIPAPQARALLQETAGAVAGALSGVTMRPVWTLMVAFATPPDLIGHPPVSDRISALMRQSDGTAWVMHMAPDWSALHLETGRDEMATLLVDQFAALVGGLPEIAYAAAHRWRFGLTGTPLGRPFAGDPQTGILAGGDWALGDRAVDAWRSGRAMAEALLSAGPPNR